MSTTAGSAGASVDLSSSDGPLLAASCLDLLLIELVPMAYRLASEMAEREGQWASGGPVQSPTAVSGPNISAAALTKGTKNMGVGTGTADAKSTEGGAGTMTSATGAATTAVDEDDMREAIFYKLEMLGYRVGLGIVERFSRDKPRFNDTLDVIKFLCKDLWTLVFRKQIDNLKTNHRGIYVLTDNSFKPLSRMSLEKNALDVGLAQAQPFLFFPAGLIRGALASMGITAIVQAETTALPGATFQIRTAGAKA